MRTELLMVNPETATGDAIELLIEHHISGLPVVDADRRIVGVLTEKDLLKVLFEPPEKTRSVGDLMTRNPTSISVDAPLVEVFDCLMANAFRRVLVHEQGRLVGLVSRADLMPTLLEAIRERA
jgi:CBS domain-containing protein